VYFILKSMEQDRTFRPRPQYPTEGPDYRILKLKGTGLAIRSTRND
jgi:hypothetical protein